MVNDRAPPKAPLQPTQKLNDDEPLRGQSPDDDDITAVLRGMSSVKGQHRMPSGSTSHPTFGHPTKMVSSLKQKADIFIHQKSRPEHHLGTKVSGPRPPSYQDRRPPPMSMYNSNAPATMQSHCGGEVFYTDPSKANADLKALLEGGMDEDEEAESGEQPKVAEEKQDDPVESDTKEQKPEQKRDFQVGKDGTVDGLKVKLLPHQVEGVNWMRGRELGPVKRGKVPKGGLLADDMGLGKTLQTVSLIMTNRKPEKDEEGWKKHFEGNQKTTLVVAPLALIRQWEHELKDKVTKSHRLKVLVHHGPQRTKNFKDLALYDVVITTYQILVSEHGNSSQAEDGLKAGCFGLHWWRVVLDEAHTIKNRNAKATKACYALRSEYRWCLSGTPMQNNLDELQSLVRFLRIKPYDDLKQWKEHIDRPLKNGKGHIAIRRLHSILRCFMKRRTKDILKEEGALNPGGEPSAKGEASATGFRHTQRNVVTVSAKLAPAERKFYNRLAARAENRIEAMIKGKLSYANAFTLLLRLRQACNHPKLVEGKLDKDKDALSTGSSQRSQDTDIDSVADMFAGMGIATKSCSVCGRELTNVDTDLGRENCSECHEDLEYFNNHEQPQNKKSKKKSKAKIEKSKDKPKADKKHKVEPKAEELPNQTVRRPRNRNAVVDSDDDEEAEGSWLVSENEQGDLQLGKAGGEEDENAEGGGDWVNAEDSADETLDDKDQSNLSSFVINDEMTREEEGYQSVHEASDNDDSLLSVSAITKQMASHTLEDKPIASQPPASATGSASDADSDNSDSDETELYSSDDDNEGWPPSSANQVLASAKIRELIRLLYAEVHEHKFIVFSQFTSMLDLMEPFLRKERFNFTRYDGSMKNDEREESLRRLREDKRVRILLCSLKCGSLGLNLTAATRVIIVEPFWNPFVEEQAIDRVHRLTQTVDVTVYKLTVANTVEERIIDLQEKKRLLAETTIEGGARKEALKLGIDEMINLFKPGGHANPDGDDGPWIDEDEAGDERHRAMQAMTSLKRKPAREESEVYGRRW
ncbi:putative ATP-dependent helicase [Tolypocladium ophioglossoides CBS 100239]|uniref:Putative ATP-dependent helicase n=1 Tax=Tolypocladium ophioglossoides (strain CBS 100239) TaxID=1163406 RepID=A0A0L0N907_TOLOC|nr:putative ATP-dependent helicase [Tolypocladium ophioglossoides CBS 100239]